MNRIEAARICEANRKNEIGRLRKLEKAVIKLMKCCGFKEVKKHLKED